MRAVDQLLETYGESHQHPTNKLIHWICVPAIFFSIVGFFYAIPLPDGYDKTMWVSWASIAMLVAYIYYFRLSIPLFVGFVLWGVLCLWAQNWAYTNVLWVCDLLVFYFNLGIFVVAWISQFIGHKIEGKKPSFLQDLQFLLVGPAWLLHFIYKKIGIRY